MSQDKKENVESAGRKATVAMSAAGGSSSSSYVTVLPESSPWKRPLVSTDSPYGFVADFSAFMQKELYQFFKDGQYEIVTEIRRGSYAVDYKALDTKKNKYVTLKEMPLRRNKELPGTAIREIGLLKELQHENILSSLDVFRTSDHIYHVIDYYKDDLESCMRFSQEWDCGLVKMLLRQILEGIRYCHTHGVLHRDLNTHTLLFDHYTNSVKISDFGRARAFSAPVEAYTDMEIRNWPYSAPEVLFGSRYYTTSVDMWSVGCIFAEMVNREVLFPCESMGGLLNKFSSILGYPDEDVWPGVSSLPFYHCREKLEDPPTATEGLAKALPHLEPAGLDLLSRMLTYDPKRRISARAALEHAYLKDADLNCDQP